jgi:cyclic pyranopterin phosphate synthase
METPSADTPKLIDRFGRHVTYVRVSITDRCDFRCVYCMSKDMTFLPRARILTLEEILFIMQGFTALGVTRIRLTGGEPLVRRNILWLVRELNRLPGLRELVLTTNGSQLEKLAGELRAAGIRRLNISLDSLQPARFRRITRVGDLARVLRGIEAARQAGFERIKINAVILKNYNHDEILDLVEFVVQHAMDITFIEEMPLGLIDEHNRAVTYYSSDAVKRDIEQRFTLIASSEKTGGPARYLRVSGTDTRVGFISPHSHNFCSSCNRVRVTTEGRLLLCLGQEHSVDLRQLIRANPGDVTTLKQALLDSMTIKPEGHDFDLGSQPVILRHMNATGG